MASKPATCVCCGVCRLCTYTTHAHSRVAHARAFSALLPFHWYDVMWKPLHLSTADHEPNPLSEAVRAAPGAVDRAIPCA